MPSSLRYLQVSYPFWAFKIVDLGLIAQEVDALLVLVPVTSSELTSVEVGEYLDAVIEVTCSFVEK